MNRLILVIALLLGIGECLADGKFFSPGPIPLDVPFQRALIVFDGEREILVVQSKYEARTEEAVRSLGWVVPVPAVPEVGTLDSNAAEFVFDVLDWATRPEAYSLFKYYFWSLLILLAFRLILRIRASRKGPLSWGRRWLLGSYAGNVVLILLLLALAGISYDGPRTGEQMKAAALAPVQVVMETTVGSYDVKVVKADESGALVGWLNQHGFRFDAADERVFADYIAKKWAFVTARITPKAAGEKSALDSRGMANPLVLRFLSKQAVYPLALTASAGRETEIELYVLHTHKMDAGGRLPLRFANKWDADGRVAHFSAKSEDRADFGWLKHRVEPERMLAGEHFAEGYISKFRGRLNAEQMKTDLVFARADDDEPHGLREYVLLQTEYGYLERTAEPSPPFVSFESTETDLHRAAKGGQTGQIESLLARGIPIDAQNGANETPLHYAARAGRVDFASILISKGANIDSQSTNGSTPLHFAASEGHRGVAELLLSKGANIDAKSSDMTPLYLAIMDGKRDVAEYLIDKGASIENGVLGEAAIRGQMDIAKLLITRGANVNALHGGRYPLDLAAQSGNIEMVRLLVEHGADVNARLGDRAALNKAATDQIRQYLLSKGATSVSVDPKPKN